MVDAPLLIFAEAKQSMKTKTIFHCRECGHESIKWQGRCPECGSWNSMREELRTPQRQSGRTVAAVPVAHRVNELEREKEERIDTGIAEVNRVLGGGLVRGSLLLLAGDPGIGKSTLALQLAEKIKTADTILYVTGEESLRQIKLRADRLGAGRENLLILAETNLELILSAVEEYKPALLIVDSIQTAYLPGVQSAPGSISQLRECTGRIMWTAKNNDVATVLIGHVTKEGSIAGPRILEHMVDTVLYFEGERYYQYRILRSFKNRFGSADELGVFRMEKEGLIEIESPSAVFLAERPARRSGSTVVPCMEGSRPILVELQALTVKSSFGQPRRMTTGPDVGRTAMLMAVLEKRVGLKTGENDIYINIVGGLKLGEPALDLGILVAVSSSIRNIAVDEEMVIMGEVGLTGEIRSINQIERRLAEAAKMGFKKALIPHGNAALIKNSSLGKQTIPVENVIDALRHAFAATPADEVKKDTD